MKLLAIILFCAAFYSHHASAAENDSWTNCAGHTLRATPIAVHEEQIEFQLQESSRTVAYPLSVFPPSEQIRLKEVLGIACIPDELKSAYGFSLRNIERLSILHRKRKIDDADYQVQRSIILQQFRDQASLMIEQNQLTVKQLELILMQLESKVG